MIISSGLEWLFRKRNILRSVASASPSGKATEGPHEEYHGYQSPGASEHQLSVPGAREGKGRVHPGSNLK